MSGYLELADGAFLGVRDGLVLGRVAGCDVVVNDTKASRRHARLIVDAGVVEIEDLNSSNGTLLNGKPVDRRMMRDGDEVRIGKTVIIYREGALPGQATSGRSAASSASIFDDEDDLFGGGSAPSSAPPAAAGAARASEDLPSNDLLGDDLMGDDLLGNEVTASAPPAKPAPPKPAPPKPAPSSVVEFEDEVVEVQQAPPPPPRRDPEPVIEVRKPQRSDAAGAAGKSTGGSDDLVASSQRVLQFSKKAAGKNPLGDDLSQMSGGMRLLVVLLGIAIGGGIIYGIMTAMQ